MNTFQSPRDIVSPRPGKRWDSKSPTKEGDPLFEQYLQEVVDVVAATERGAWSTDFLKRGNPTPLEGQVPRLIAKKLRLGTDHRPNPMNLALAVSMDKPWHLGEFLLDALIADGANFKIDRPTTIQFCDKDASYMQTMAELNTECMKALDRVFDVKYYWKQPRPEDYKGVPGVIFNADDMPAPGHYRYAAGHGAVSGATVECLIKNLDLSSDMEQEVIHAGWVFSHGRTFLGVHFHEDNAEGFRIGRSVV